MSKLDGLRAMREAKYEASRAGARAKAPASPAAPAPARTRPAEPAAPAGAAPAAAPELCGHRSMNGRTCTREHGHEAKSHRYS
ncbi:hypothetical protein [Nocardioides marmoribigeumensis]|uniref:Membrane protein n=1 Tax=Nocardioides marmoribigeumensis TaxID=433649 RepID=A0ABU2BSU2_9ACTN|nr:hypothetical protein [Nocardioides marmoribigeumensis]MDR7361341.1 putative membrane protein [Nocardioides marmoribigeumensis]